MTRISDAWTGLRLLGGGPKHPSWLLALALLVSTAAVAVVCGVSLISLRGVSSFTESVVARHMAMLNDTSVFESLLFHRGLAAEYMLTGDRSLLSPLDTSRETFENWLTRARSNAANDEARRLLSQIERDHAEYQATRSRAIALFDEGNRTEALSLLLATHQHIGNILKAFRGFNSEGQEQAEATLAAATASTYRLGWVIVLTSVLAVLASLAAGTLFAQRVARPIYELQLQMASVAERMRVEVRPHGDLGGLASDVAALVQRLENMDAELVEQRRRLIQSEKLSAVGEIAAKLAHEVLNPLTGMKAAARVLARSAQTGSVEVAAIRETAESLDREIGRVNDLVRRLVDFSRPLAPRLDSISVSQIFNHAIEASQQELEAHRVTLRRHEEDGLPQIHVDPLLMTQALTNLLCNAAQAMSDGGAVEMGARKVSAHGREHVVIDVRDEGPGISAAVMEKLFHPFVTTKTKGHGLGLAVCENIINEHGGRITAQNRGDRPGAVFEVWIPTARLR